MSSTAGLQPLSGARSRTRRAILDAAARLWSANPSASLGDIADQAQVSRSTLHRYFPERQDLFRELLLDSKATMESVWTSIDVTDTPPLDTMENLLRALVSAGDRILFLFGDLHRYDTEFGWEDDGADSLTPVIQRAQADGFIDPDLHPRWVESSFYSLVYTAALTVSDGLFPQHIAADNAVRTFLHGVSPR